MDLSFERKKFTRKNRKNIEHAWHEIQSDDDEMGRETLNTCELGVLSKHTKKNLNVIEARLPLKGILNNKLLWNQYSM